MSEPTRRSRMNRRTFLTAAALAVPAIATGARSVRAQTSTELRIATTWPAASGPGRALTAWGASVARRTSNALTLRLYFASSMGTDLDFVRKLERGQLEGALLSSWAMGERNAPLFAVDAPGVSTTHAKLDAVRTGMMSAIHDAFSARELKLMGFSDLGAQRVFARRAIVAPPDMVGTRMWAGAFASSAVNPWQRILTAAGVAGNGATVAEVTTQLQSSLLDAYPATALEAVANGWNTRSTHFTGGFHCLGSTATVVTHRAFNALPATSQVVLLETGAQAHVAMRAAVRRDDDAAVATCVRLGATRVDTAPAQAAWAAVLQAARASLVGRAYSAEELARVEQLAASVP
ncbi:MAG: TRAP transporter substrate-binding protein DctP [Sandaracinaceae bacterium]|nr:TRAP transporter substrate-binding protein DctP [Sandaracinaceae bacterium]